MHTLICGVTASGKTTLAHAIAAELAKHGHGIIVYDPVLSETAAGKWPEKSVLFSDEEEFFEYLARPDVRNAHVFVDEAGEVFNLGKRHNFWLLTRGRHFGLQVYMIAQRPKMIAPTARTQASIGYVFRLAPADLKDVLADFGHGPDTVKKELDAGDFLCLHSGQASISRANIFNFLER